MQEIAEFAAIVASRPPAQGFQALEALVQDRVGAVIFSCSTFDLAQGKSRRIHTNMADVYPVSGLKDIVPNAWTRVVLEGGESFVANRIEDIREVFPDHALIESLGCGSVINMPVYLAGEFLGTVNALHRPGHFTDARVAALQALQPAALLAFAAFRVKPFL